MRKPENRKWKVVSSEYILREGAWCTVRRECVELPNGVRVPRWYIFEFPNWVNVIAVTREGNMVLISQYRHALGDTYYELPAGVIDATDVSPLEAAQRELLEETGFGGGTWSEFMRTSPNPTNHTNLQYTFLAEGVERISAQQPEPSEDIDVHIVPQAEVREMLEQGGFVQALHMAPLWRYFAIKQ